MSFYRSLAVLCIVSLICGAGLCLLQMAFTQATGSGAYAVLITSSDIPDKEIRGLLSESDSILHSLSDSVISESSQWVFLDDFSELKQIPLHEYNVLPLDPRNDGYATRLSSFFVRDDRRLLFIPLHSAPVDDLNKRMVRLLGNVPFSLEFIGVSKPLGFFFIIFGCACAILLIFRFLPCHPRMEIMEIFFCLPVLGAFAFYGAGGFVLSALLMGIVSLLKEPMAEASMLLRGRGPGSPLYQKEFAGRFRRDAYGPFRVNWLLASGLLVAYILVSIFTRVPYILSGTVLVIFSAAFVFAVITWSRRGERQSHTRFLPVLMIKPTLNPLLLGLMLPFLLAAVAAGVSAPALPAGPDSPDLISLQGDLISEEEYLAHAAYQSSFSWRLLGENPEQVLPVGRSAAGHLSPEGLFPAYTLTAESLIAPLPGENAGHLSGDIPPFPLKSLMEFLADRRGDKNRKK